MGLRCSLLGHDFGDPEVENEREERGSEVVLTVREVSECTRCGKTKIVSENKEVTAIHESSDDSGGESHIEDGDVSEPSIDDAPESGDDAVIMDDDSNDDEDERAHGEWPEPTHVADDSPTESVSPSAWPEIEDSDEGFDAKPATGGETSVDFGGGLTPEHAEGDEEAGLEYIESEPADETGFARVGEAPVPSEPADVDVNAEFVCPQCGFIDDVAGSSLRAGDVCPDCRRGYLAEQ